LEEEREGRRGEREENIMGKRAYVLKAPILSCRFDSLLLSLPPSLPPSLHTMDTTCSSFGTAPLSIIPSHTSLAAVAFPAFHSRVRTGVYILSLGGALPLPGREGGREGRREGGREGRKEGRREGGKEGGHEKQDDTPLRV